MTARGGERLGGGGIEPEGEKTHGQGQQRGDCRVGGAGYNGVKW